MVGNQFLSNNFWRKKIRHKDTAVFSKKEVSILKIEIFKNDLKDFIKISKNNPLSKFTIISSIFSFLLKKYFSNFQNTIKIYPSNLLDSEKHILLEVRDNDFATFKDLLQAAANEIKETFSYKDYNPLELNLDSFSNYSIQFGQKVSDIKDNISLLYEETDDKLILTVYHQEINKEYLIESLLNNFRDILSDYASVLNQEINFYSLADLKTREQILLNFNATDVFYPEEETIVGLFEKQVEKTPEDTALVYEGVRLRYKELNEESNLLAHYLIDKYNIQGDDLICIQLPRSERMIIAILGILKSGGAYVPIDPEYPTERIEYILEDTRCKALIDESFWRSYESLKGECSKDNPASVISPDDLAYVIYTSGTTGNPKGVMIEHRNVFNSTMNRVTFYSIESMLLIPSFSFDSSVAVIFGVLCSGGRLFIEDNNKVKDVEYISSRIIKYNIEGILCVPNYYSNLLPYLNENDAGKNNLKHVIVAGEELVKNLVLNHQKHSEAILYNEYGPTECSVWSTVSIVTNTNVNIGKPISNTQIYILDEYGHLVPPGVVGELYIAGAGLARGYLNREDLTEEKFLANPFVDGTKMYRTGDLGKWLPDGNIEYLGRIDHQVKIRGHRIELGEIDSHVLTYSDSIKSVVTEVKDHEGDRSLVVYYVSGSTIDKHDLSRYLAGKLPQYMLPGFYVELDVIPLTTNGKIDRKSLPDVSSSDLIRNEYVAPETAEEKILVSVLEQVLKHSPISIRDNYYNLGGDSIKSIQIVSRLRQQGYSLKVEHILQYPVLEELARYMTTEVVKIDQSVVTGSSTLTPIQRYFFESKYIVNKNHYNQSVILKSTERLSVSVLEASIKRLVEHHDCLRMVYSKRGEEWTQYNEDIGNKHYRFDSYDLRDEDHSIEEEQERLHEIGTELQSSIDITSGVLFHVGHVSVSDGDRIILVVHHLVVDGVSWRILLEDLGKLYEFGVQGLSYELPSKTDSFQSWGKALYDYSRSRELLKERAYWEDIELEEYASIVPDYPLGEKHILGSNLSFSLGTESTKLLQTQAGKQYGAEINDVLLTGLALALQEHFGIVRTKVLMEGHGRESMKTGLDISRTVGWFTSVYPFSLDISNKSQPELVSVKEGLRGIPNKGIGYGILHYLDHPFTPNSPAQVQFNYLGDFDDAGNHDTGEAESLFSYSTENIGSSVGSDNLLTDILLDISGMTVNGEMNISIRYSERVFHKSTIEALLSSYQSHLERSILESRHIDGEDVILTPSDFTYKKLSFTTIQQITKDIEIEDLYELSPMQQGLYYHWMVDSKDSAYFMQTSYRVNSAYFEVSHIKDAFSILINHYSILRTSFTTQYGEVPLQIVHKEAHLDFRHLVLDSEEELGILKQSDVDRGFNLNEPTQMRLTLVELNDGEYEFIWSHHHIIMDGWCLGILINDFSKILGSIQQGTSFDLGIPQNYSSYIRWLEGIDKEEARSYWENYLEGISSPTIIPFKKENQETESRFVDESIKIEGEEFTMLNNFCQGLGITLNTYVQGVWSYLLSRYNSSDEVVFGSVVSGRPAELEGVEHMVGLFINTIPVRVVVDHTDTSRSLLSKIHQDSIRSTRYHFGSLAEIQSLSSLGKELINNLVIFENYVRQESSDSVAGLNSKQTETFEHTNYDFNIVVIPESSSLQIEFRYYSSVYNSSAVTSSLAHFDYMMYSFMHSPDVVLSEVDYLGEKERTMLLDDFNATDVFYPEEETIVGLFEKQVEKTPEDTALVYEGVRLRYKELNEESNLLAHYLIDKYNIQGDDLICIQLPRSERMIIAILGILKSGGAYVPIDPEYPTERIEYILEDTRCKALIDESFWRSYESLKGECSKDNPASVISPDDLAYVIYTSGTTGNPKGVSISHSNLLNYIVWSNSYYFTNGNRGNWGLFTSISFDLSVTSVYSSLTRGGCLYLGANSEDILSVLIKSFENKDIDILKLTPSHISLLKNQTIADTGIRKIILGGEKLYKEHIQIIRSIHKDIEIYNEYGPTEATVGCITEKVDQVSTSIGKPISNTQICILDSHGHLVPVGVSGELYISGAGLARGYLNLPDLTEEKFVDNPFVPGTKMYRTGDLGRWLPDGNIEYLGRIDHQVKIRGHRIELGEIDSHVLTYSDSIKNVVTEVKEHDGDKSLVVYYVSDTGIDKQDLSQYLEGKLPQYMLPSFYVELDKIPLTTNGKIDRKALPEVSSSDLIKNEYIAPTSEEEQVLVSICEQVLKHNPISIRDNYYNLGGDSIKSIQIVSRLRQQGYSLKVEHILQYPVLEELARYITRDVVNIDQSAVTGTSILTPIQRYFFESEDIVNKNYYNQCVILKSTERLSGPVLESSLQALVSHHDALRMEYHQNDGLWSQYNQGTEGKNYHFEYFDVRGGGESEEISRLKEIGESLQNSINIESGILFQVGHVSMSDGDRLLLIIHHLVVDGVSWRILLEDLGKLYESGIQGLSPDLPSKTDSFQSWGRVLEEYSSSSALSKELVYWKDIESEIYSSLPTDYPVIEKHIFDKTIGFSFTKEQTHLLQTRAGKQYSAEINDVLLTGLALSLQDQFGINRTKVLMEGHGREVMNTGLDISRTIGWFTSVYPFSLDISSKDQPALVSVKEGLRGIPHKGIGHGILKYLGQGLSSAERPSVQFNYLGDFDDTTGSLFHYTTEDIGYPVSEDNQRTDILLDVSGMTVNGEMNINIRYSGNLFNESTVQKLVDRYKVHLEEMTIVDEEQKMILTPSDLTYNGLSFNTIQEINKDNEIEDIYELSPMQQGLYYHWLVDPKGSTYFMQTSYRIKSETLDLSKVEKAFGKLLNRYTILRTSFDNRYGDVPLQIVHQQAKVDFKYQVIESKDSLESDLEMMRNNDIIRGFALNNPTQLRVILVGLPDGEYEFIWSYHHIVMDGWCLSILINDFSVILDSLQQEVELNLLEPQKYSSYLKWLRNVDQNSSLQYWENYLKGISAATLIPFEKNTKEEKPHFATEKFSIGEEELKEISQVCQQLGITLNTYVQAAWSYLLSSYNASEEIIFGSVVSGRPPEIEGIESMVGLFINTIPVRIKVNKDETPRSLLKKLHQDSIQSTRNHFSSLAEIQSLSPLGKDLISNIVIFENYVKSDQENFENVTVFDQSNYDFTLAVEPDENSLNIDFEYNTSVYSSSIIALASHLKNTLSYFKTFIDQPLSEFDYLSSVEKELLLKDFNNTFVQYPDNQSIVRLFEDQVGLTPEDIAVVYDGLSLSYSELNEKASSLAVQLRSAYGIKKGDQVGVMLNRGENQIVSILGILKLGAVYVPVDANLPESRKEVMTSGLSLLITESFYFFDLDFYAGDSLAIDVELTGEGSEDFESTVLNSDDIAYIIYTSGSTGEPKGVLNTHGGILNTMLFQKDFFKLSECNTIAQFSSFSFDASISEIFMTLLSGKSLHILSDAVRKDALAFEEYVDKHSIDLVTLPPAFFSLLNMEKLQKLKGIITAGEAAIAGKAKEFLKYGTFYNAYGPTETSICATAYSLDKGYDLEFNTIPIGKPIANTSIYILDSNENLVPIGVSGELYITGSGLSRGYLNRADLTAEKFVDNPFAEGIRMYRTGDLGRWLPDGNIEYLGRIDHQVKIRGHRIELGEIDSHVLTYSDSIKNVVTEVKEHDGDKSLVVYYVSDTGIDKQDLSQYLEGKLPQYMLPSFYVELDKIPLTTNGKIDRKALPEVSSSDLIKNEYIAPTSEEEQVLVSICEQVLKHNPISIRDNYYNLGGDSIKSIQIVSRLRQQGYSLKVEHILQYPVLEELARYITRDVVNIDQSAVTGTSILTPIQRYFFESEDIVNKNYYNQCVILKSTERLSGPVLESSLQALVSHHDALRMEYHQNDGLWSQYNQGTEGKNYHFEYFDVRGGGESEEISRLKEIGESLQNSINIESGILFQVGHVSMSDGDRLLLIIHHLVVDGVSWRILLEDLGKLYESGIQGLSPDLPSKTDSFQSWGRVLEEYSSSSALSKELVYWKDIESEIYSSLPTDYPVIEKHIFDKTIGFSFTKEQTHLLQTRAGKQYSAEINDVLLTGLALSLQDQFGINRTKVLMEGHGREVMNTGLDISRTIGWFTSVYPFSLDISSKDQPALVSVKEGLRGIPHKGIGHGILKYLGQGLSSAERPSVQFNYLGDFDDTTGSLFHYTTEDIGYPVSEDNQRTDILLDVSGMTVNGEMNINIRYSGNLFNESTVQKLVDRYKVHLEEMTIVDEEQKMILTPSDLTYNGLSFNTIQEINKDNEIEDIYELSPMQQGLYYHWLVDPKGSTYFIQTSYRVQSSSLNPVHIEKAFGTLVNRYAILRTSFKSNFGEVPLQLVHKNARVDFKYIAIESEESFENTLRDIKQNDISKGLSLDEATQMRLTVVKLFEGEYEFIWSHHHIIMDGWCLSILINDFSTILHSLQQGIEISLPEPLKYSSYIKWLEGVDKEEGISYWKKYLKDFNSLTVIPFVKEIKEVPVFLIEKINISNAEFKAIHSFCQNIGITLNTYIQGVWSYLLSQYNTSKDVIFGSVVSGRPAELEGIENMVGLFINTIPVRIHVDKNDTPNSLLKKLHQDSIQSTEYHFNSLAEIQLQSSLGKDLINNIIVFENFIKSDDKTSASAVGLTHKKAEAFDLNNYDFNIVAVPATDSLEIEFRYNSSAFHSSSVMALVSHFKNVLNEFNILADQPLSRIGYLGTEEKEMLLETFNSTEILYPSDRTIINLFEEQVSINPESVAVVFDGVSLSYQELNDQACTLAYQLQTGHGIQKGDHIGVMLGRSEKQIISILGILKLGAVYVPIDVNLPESRKSIMSEGLQLLITESFFFFDLDFYDGESFAIDVELDGEKIEDFVSIEVAGSDIAYIIYTSGSTGEPKGVLTPHSGIMNTMLSQIQIFDVAKCERVGQFASFSFDASISEIFMTLLAGKTLYILNDTVRKDTFVFENYIDENNIDLITLPPAFFSLVNTGKLKKMKGIITAGEEAILGKTKEYLQYGTFYNAYGPTESSICASVYTLEKGCSIEFTSLPIGKPIANTRMYILDEHKHLVPVGVMGELYIAGAGLADGYLNREELTSERFIDNPFVQGTKMYRTGDLGKWLPDGNIEYLGRIDNQVKIRGHRIELGEIDSQVRSYSDAIKSVVTHVKDHEGSKILAVYYVSDVKIDKQHLLDYLETKLPQYMLPGFYVELETIPLTSSGKVDRQNLPDVTALDLITNVYVAPSTQVEKILVEICEQVLKHSPISIKDNYYNLGGDSIKSIQIVSRLRQHGYIIKVEQILQYPVLEELSHYMISETVLADQSLITGNSILTPIQRNFLESEDIVNKNHYNQSVILKSNERLSGTVLESSIRSLVAHHDALRMEYRKENGIWNQYNAGIEVNHYHFEYVDVREVSSPEEELVSLRRIGERIQNTINIGSGILFHIAHVSMSDGDRIILAIHQLVVDEISWKILLEDLENLYRSGVKKESYELPSKTDSFQRWGAALEEYGNSSAFSKNRLYWETIESEIYPVIPTDYPANGKYILDKHMSFSFNKEQTQLLETQVGKKYNAGISDVLLAGLALSLQKQLGIGKTKVLIEDHSRDAVGTGLDISRTLGWFTSVYPFSLDISDVSQPAIVSVKESLRGIPHKEIDYGILKYLQNTVVSTSLPSVRFRYLGDLDDAIGSVFYRTTEDIGSPVSKENLETEVLLDVSGISFNGEMTITISYSDKVFNETTIQKLSDMYQVCLAKMISENTEQGTVLTPSDLTYKDLSFNILSDINRNNDIEDIYELSPMQQGLYYHWLAAPEGSAYFIQSSYRIRSANLDISLVEKAFGIVVNHYPTLRTSFNSHYAGTPLQIVHKQARIDFRHIVLKTEIFEEELQKIKEKDITDGFELDTPTQMRLQVVELLNGDYEFIWSHHHIIMDGWCLNILINDFTTALNVLQNGDVLQLAPASKYSSYIKWLGEIDTTKATEHWENYLKGFNTPTTVPFAKEKNSDMAYHLASHIYYLENDVYDDLKKFCQTSGITLNSYVQGVWSYLLSVYNANEEVVFGSVVSGRPPQLEGVENMVGLFINTLPVRIRIEQGSTPEDLLKKIHQDSIDNTDYHHVNLADIQSRSVLKRNLINHILIFENLDIDDNEGDSQLTNVKNEKHIQTTYNFNFEIIPTDSEFRIMIDYNRNLFDDYSVVNIVKAFKDTLVFFMENKSLPFNEISSVLETQSLHFKAIKQKDIKEAIPQTDSGAIKLKNLRKLNAFINKNNHE